MYLTPENDSNCKVRGVYLTLYTDNFPKRYTVEALNNGHVGDEHFVHCSEVVPSSEVEMYGQYRQGGEQCVHCREVVHYSECPLSEVPLYCSQIQPNLSCQEAVRDYILFKMALQSTRPLIQWNSVPFSTDQESMKRVNSSFQLHKRKWGVNSPVIKLNRGIRQGSVLSPLLFLLVMDSLLFSLANAEARVLIGGINTGSLCHADDLCLKPPYYPGPGLHTLGKGFMSTLLDQLDAPGGGRRALQVIMPSTTSS